MATSPLNGLLARTATEIGLQTLYHSPRDVKILCFQRFVRLFATGACSLIFALYLSGLGVSDTKIGLFMSLTLLGNVFFSFLWTLMADSLGRRNVLGAGAILMIASGIIFGLASNYWALLAAAVFGVMSSRSVSGASL